MCESVMKSSHNAMSSKELLLTKVGDFFWKRCSQRARYCFLPLGKDKMKMRKIAKVYLSSLQSILAELLLSDHQSCSFIKDLAEGHTRQKKILNSSNNEQLKVAGKLKVVLSSLYVWLCKELYLISEQ